MKCEFNFVVFEVEGWVMVGNHKMYNSSMDGI